MKGVRPALVTLPVFLFGRNLAAEEKMLNNWEQRLLYWISRVYYLPPWCSLADYQQIFAGLHIKGWLQCANI